LLSERICTFLRINVRVLSTMHKNAYFFIFPVRHVIKVFKIVR
jgi:hypothetical protein